VRVTGVLIVTNKIDNKVSTMTTRKKKEMRDPTMSEEKQTDGVEVVAKVLNMYN